MSKLKITLVLKQTFCSILLIGYLNNSVFSQRVAQPTPLKKWEIGFNLSNNFAWYKQIDGAMENNGLGVGFSYGLSANYRLTPSPNYWGTLEFLVSTAPVKIKNTGKLKMNVSQFGRKDLKDTKRSFFRGMFMVPYIYNTTNVRFDEIRVSSKSMQDAASRSPNKISIVEDMAKGIFETSATEVAISSAMTELMN